MCNKLIQLWPVMSLAKSDRIEEMTIAISAWSPGCGRHHRSHLCGRCGISPRPYAARMRRSVYTCRCSSDGLIRGRPRNARSAGRSHGELGGRAGVIKVAALQ